MFRKHGEATPPPGMRGLQLHRRSAAFPTPERINARSKIFPLITPMLKKATAVAVARCLTQV
jgi:hypothetical protein